MNTKYQVILKSGQNVLSTWGTYSEKSSAVLMMVGLLKILTIRDGDVLAIREVNQ